jgi:REP element-mobilizing transposase RayT
MPDHAHFLFTLKRVDGREYPMANIMHSVRGAAAHRINKLLSRQGAVWEEEFFDRLLRYGEFEGTVNYICGNPVQAGLVQHGSQYPWLWIATDV